jgi:hypothetical protein
MKHLLFAIIICLICSILALSCRTQPSLPSFQKPAHVNNLPVYDSNGSPVVMDSTKFDSLLSIILVLESAIYSQPRGKGHIPLLLKASFDSASGCFLVVGKGTHNKSMPESSWRQGRKIASAYDANRWALYLKAWSLGRTIAFGTRISGEISYSKILLEKLENDTLYALVSIPMGSVIEK